MQIGFIGLGIMGKPMALNILQAGYSLKAFDINEAAAKAVQEAGAVMTHSNEETVEGSDVIFTMLPTAAIIEDVLLNQLLPAVKEGAIVVDMSSVSPVDSKRWADALAEKQVEFIDAPVSGGEPKAIDGTLSIMAGGKEEAFEKVLPVLKTVGEDVVRVGEAGAGSTTKLANQILVNVTMAAMSEAVLLASKAGVDIEKMYEAIRGGLAGSTVLDAKIPKILERDFEAGGRIDINLKDLRNVLSTGKEIGMPLPLTSDVAEMFESLAAHGRQTDDHSGVLQYYETLSNYQVPKGGKSE
ncbi:2-hydroxy-3-oxopropionate reductase [Alteribacillus persepolensis]|uniref:2-hydroxy-3-oxopropionate reductase n=2 Tax=Alteribacillus persepolensis TaxID=568899 RepID=A0A1G8FST7_9BACI|nr:2-hydroxy-3-oxopropionate reductase [Alteribacillus persepolensis]